MVEENVEQIKVEEPEPVRKTGESNQNTERYLLPAAILVASIILSLSILHSAGMVSGDIQELKVAFSNMAAGPGTGPSVTPTPVQTATQPAGDGGDLGEPSDRLPPGVSVSGRTARGGKGAKVVIVDFTEMQCPFCNRAEKTMAQLLQEYGDKIKIYFKHFPLRGMHPQAQKAGEAVECAGMQGKFWEYHDVLVEHSNALQVDDLKGYASQLGLDTATFNQCLDNDEAKSIVDGDFAEGTSLGISGVPTIYINGKKIVGAQPYEVFKQAIDEALQAVGEGS